MKKLTQASQTAKLIRQDLKKEFPGIKFKVTSSTYSMGNSVDIRWLDGPTEGSVDSVAGKYQYGYFNAMEDIYESTNVQDFPQVKFVSASRTYTDNTLVLMDSVVKEVVEENGWHEGDAKVRVRRVMHKLDLSNGEVTKELILASL